MTLLSLRSVRAKMLAWSGLTTVPALLAAAATLRDGHSGVVLAAGAGGAVLSMLVSLRLHRAITRPLHEIADAARRVVSRGDYSVRARKIADDETGTLADAFNDMLAEIERGDRTLGESHARFRSLVEATAQIMWVADARGMTAGPAPSWQAYTGQSEAEMSGDGWVNGLHPEDARPALLAWRAAVVTQSAFEHECRVRGSDGRFRWFAARGVPVRRENGSIHEWVCVCTDIDERRRGEEETRQLIGHLLSVSRSAGTVHVAQFQ